MREAATGGAEGASPTLMAAPCRLAVDKHLQPVGTWSDILDVHFLGYFLLAPTASTRLYFWSLTSVPFRQVRSAGAPCMLQL